ncbi:MAG: peptidoglycan-binding protein [Chitinispirillaceae bacterium]|nr:peptidoglycan-binding protein [Chitinispirillaceae bacterium]
MGEMSFSSEKVRESWKNGTDLFTCNAEKPCTVTVDMRAAVWCIRMYGFYFETEKCFLLPAAMKGIKKIKTQYDTCPGYAILIVGHADTRGGDSYNSTLSLERADSIHAYLQDTVEAWLDWYGAAKSASKRWGTREDQYMLSRVPENGPGYYTGTVDGIAGPATAKAARAFQEDSGLKVDGIIGPQTRRALIREYMGLDNTSLPAGSPVTTHGCGEFFPEVPASADAAFTAGEEKRQSKNRRVEIFFFRDGIVPPPPGKLSGKESTEYPQWKAAATEIIDIETEGPEGEIRIQFLKRPGQPLAGAKAILTTENDRVVSKEKVTDSTGCISWKVPEGRYFVELEKGNHHVKTSVPVLTDPAGTEYCEVFSPAVCKVRIQYVNAAENPVAGAVCRLVNDEGDAVSGDALTDSNGEAAWDEVCGELFVDIEHGGKWIRSPVPLLDGDTPGGSSMVQEPA